MVPSSLEVIHLNFHLQCGASCQAMAWVAPDHLEAAMPTPTSSTIHITTLVNGKVVASTKSVTSTVLPRELKEEAVVKSVVVVKMEERSGEEERRDQGVVEEQ